MSDQRVALVTGSTGGIGAAVAVELGRAGLAVVVTGRSADAVEAKVAELTDAGFVAFGSAADLTQPEDVDGLVQGAVERFGRLDAVVNCAGVMETSPLRKGVTAAWERAFDVNLLGSLRVCKAAFSALRRSKGTIVHVASVAGERPMPLYGAYAASKAALISLTHTMAAEWAPYGIRVNAVAPGIVDTEMAAAQMPSPDAIQAVHKTIALRRLAEPGEVAALIGWLVSEQASYCTGGVYPVHGGH